MSRFSGKSDLYDFLYMHADAEGRTSSEEYRRNIRIFVGKDMVRNESDKDLVPYYPFVGSFGAGRDGATFQFGPMSHVDWEDFDILSKVLCEVNRAYRKMVRKKLPKTVEQIVELVGNAFDYLAKDGDDPVPVLAKRKLEMGRKVSVPLIPSEYRLTRRDFYRKELEEEMVKWGYTPKEAHEWCFAGRKTWP